MMHTYEEFDSEMDEDVEQLWAIEVQKRLAAYRSGELQAIPGDDAMAEVRRCLAN